MAEEIDDELKTLSVEELKGRLRESLKDYEEWVRKGIPINEDWDDELFYIINTRDEIHLLIKAIQNKGGKPEKDKLMSIDAQWQAFSQKNTDSKYAPYFDRKNEPYDKWWWWIDKIDDLSDMQRRSV